MSTRRINAFERERAVHAIFAAPTGTVIEMRAGGVKLEPDSSAVRELLAQAVAREQVELEIDILAYEQEPGKRNYNCFRFTPGAMGPLGRSGVGTVYLRDHNKWDSTAIGGRIIASESKKLRDGHYQLVQTVSLREPTAVERALRGLMGAVSIGALATGPVLCSHCETEVLTECWHCPGDVIKATADGESDEVVEWVYTSAILKETSEVPIGAVPSAGVTNINIRAAIEAAIAGPSPTNQRPGGSSFALDVAAHPSPSARPPKTQETTMKTRAAIVAKLKLVGLLAACINPAEPTDEEIEGGIDALIVDRAELAIAREELATGQASAVEAFVADGIKTRRIKASEADNWRTLFNASPDRARELMGKRQGIDASLVGQPRQSDAPQPTEASATSAANDAAAAKGVPVAATGPNAARDTEAKKVLAANHVDHGKAIAFARKFGAKDPAKAVAKVAGVEV